MAAALPSLGRKRLAALLAGVLLFAAPLLWIWWSLAAAAEAKEAIRIRSDTLAALQARLSVLSGEAGSAGALADETSLYLPGQTAAIAGAALQRIVAEAVGEAGGRLAESEVTSVAPQEEDPGRVALRVAFDADIVGLQDVLFRLETGLPILVLRGLSVQTGDAAAAGDDRRPTLRIVLLVEGRREV